MVDAASSDSFAIALVNQLPAIIAAVAALVSATLGWRNRKIVIDAAEGARIAAASAAVAVVKADETHAMTVDISAKTDAISNQTEQVKVQTDGHFSKLIEQVMLLTAERAAFQKTIITLTNVLTAQRVAQAGADKEESITVPSVRAEDLAQAVDTVGKISKDLTAAVETAVHESVDPASDVNKPGRRG